MDATLVPITSTARRLYVKANESRLDRITTITQPDS
jgi:hypothetical protein